MRTLRRRRRNRCRRRSPLPLPTTTTTTTTMSTCLVTNDRATGIYLSDTATRLIGGKYGGDVSPREADVQTADVSTSGGYTRNRRMTEGPGKGALPCRLSPRELAMLDTRDYRSQSASRFRENTNFDSFSSTTLALPTQASI